MSRLRPALRNVRLPRTTPIRPLSTNRPARDKQKQQEDESTKYDTHECEFRRRLPVRASTLMSLVYSLPLPMCPRAYLVPRLVLFLCLFHLKPHLRLPYARSPVEVHITDVPQPTSPPSGATPSSAPPSSPSASPTFPPARKLVPPRPSTPLNLRSTVPTPTCSS